MKDATDYIEFYNNLESPLAKSDLELWEKIAERTKEKPKVKVYQMNWARYAVAASILIIAGTTLFMKFYTQSISSEKGEHLSYILPDGSGVELNAATVISYQPYWWSFNREVVLSGEAFFDVEKGEKFKIISENGITEIFGTSFNIYTRNSEYKVFCETGKVKVSSTKSDLGFILQPGELAVIDNVKKEGEKTTVNAEEYVSWRDNKFVFTSTPVKEVFEELERQYNTELVLDVNNVQNFLYTGNFKRPIRIETALNFVCKSFEFTFTKTNNAYKISNK